MANQLSSDDFQRFFLYYDQLEHQREAIDELWRRMPVDLLRDDCLWVQLYRTPKTSEYNPGHINADGIELIKRWEGLRTEAYICPAGVWTIGYGSTGDHVYPDLVITEKEAETLLLDDLVRFEDCVNEEIKVALTTNQFSALVSFCFNVGCGAFHDSTLRRRLNEGQDIETVIRQELPRWVHGGGEILPGLVSRRNDEIALACKP
jgi:lysozyme